MSDIQIYQPHDITLIEAARKNKPNSLITNTQGHHFFGFFPANNHGLPEAEIVLKLGLIGYGYKRAGGFGLRHIWEKHGKDLGMVKPGEVVDFIESIIRPGAEIIIDTAKAPDKPLIIESSCGLVILSVTPSAYSITSAYNRKSHPGTVIAKI